MTPFFFSLRSLVLFAIIVWFVIYWRFGAYLLNDLRKTLPKRATRTDGLLMGMIGLFSAWIWITALFILRGRIHFQDGWLSSVSALLGLCLTLLGIGGTFYARHQLGRLWTAAAELQPNHRVVDEGLYRRMRHPIYTFAMLLNLGFCLVFPTWWNILFTFFILLGYARKAQGEEVFLQQALPGYKDYTQRVRYRILPGIW